MFYFQNQNFTPLLELDYDLISLDINFVFKNTIPYEFDLALASLYCKMIHALASN
jgi:hypothetical protein